MLVDVIYLSWVNYMQYKKIMCLDYGDARIGIAFSDFLQITSNPYEIYFCKNLEDDLKYLTNLAHNNSVGLIVIGMPYSLDGSLNDRTKKTQEFGDMLHNLSNIDVIYEDERLSSYEAEEILKRKKIQPKDRKKHLDMLSAAIILEAYLNNRKGV